MMDRNLTNLTKIIDRHFSKPYNFRDRSRIADLLEITFLASTITDEGRAVRCSISVFDSDQVDTDTPELLRLDRRSIIPLTDPLPLTPEQLARLSQAVKPHAAAIAVRPATEGGWTIWAIIDQEHLIQGFRHHQENTFYPRAGRFQVEIESPGCIATYHNSVMLARLCRDSLIEDFQDAFHEGPLAEALDSLAEQHISRILRIMRKWPKSSHKTDQRNQRLIGVPIESLEIWLERAKKEWFAVLSRILLEIRQFRHGGAILIIPRARFSSLNVKYKIDYRRTEEALAERCASEIMELGYRHFGLETEDDEQVRNILVEVNEAERRSKDAARAQAGAVQFVASLSGIDGLIVAVRGLNIRGFGAEILTKDDPKTAFSASNALGSNGTSINPTLWGTRHRSMMRYCFKYAGSIGLVVSQDGDVRAMVRVGDRLLVWPNIDLERSAVLPFEIPCERCSSVGGLVPIRPVDDKEIN